MLVDDVDHMVLSMLSYQDLMIMCQTNSHFYHLCHENKQFQLATNKAKTIMAMQRQSLCLNITNDITKSDFDAIVGYLKIRNVTSVGFFNPVFIYVSIVKKYDFGIMMDDIMGHKWYLFPKTLEQMEQFLTMCYYNNLILIF